MKPLIAATVWFGNITISLVYYLILPRAAVIGLSGAIIVYLWLRLAQDDETTEFVLAIGLVYLIIQPLLIYLLR